MDDFDPLEDPIARAQFNVEISAHDARVTLFKLVELRNDPTHKPFFSPQVERELWASKNALDVLLSCIRIDNGEEPGRTPAGLPKNIVRMIRNA